MNEECLICKASLEYLESDILMECELCYKKETAKKSMHQEQMSVLQGKKAGVETPLT